MGNIQSFSLPLIVLLAASNMIIAESASAQQIPNPSIPEFTVKLDGGYVVVSIENQQFNSSYDKLYYNVRISPHSQNSWTELYPIYADDSNPGYPPQSDALYTEISIAVDEEGALNSDRIIPAGAQTDIQVEALAGHMSRVYNPNATNPAFVAPWTFVNQSSGWSGNQTINIPAPMSTAKSAPPNAIGSPISTLITEIVVAVVAVLAVAVAVLLYVRHQKSAQVLLAT
jgi:hypothetical protein